MLKEINSKWHMQKEKINNPNLKRQIMSNKPNKANKIQESNQVLWR